MSEATTYYMKIQRSIMFIFKNSAIFVIFAQNDNDNNEHWQVLELELLCFLCKYEEKELEIKFIDILFILEKRHIREET